LLRANAGPLWAGARSLEGADLRRPHHLLLCSAALIWRAVAGSTSAGAEEPTREACTAAVEQAQSIAAALPAEDVSRYFAERDLHQALVEAGNGEFDDCLEAVARATDELRERRHRLQPGERLDVLRPDQVPSR
jgi:hypothetical protein